MIHFTENLSIRLKNVQVYKTDPYLLDRGSLNNVRFFLKNLFYSIKENHMRVKFISMYRYCGVVCFSFLGKILDCLVKPITENQMHRIPTII